MAEHCMHISNFFNSTQTLCRIENSRLNVYTFIYRSDMVSLKIEDEAAQKLFRKLFEATFAFLFKIFLFNLNPLGSNRFRQQRSKKVFSITTWIAIWCFCLPNYCWVPKREKVVLRQGNLVLALSCKTIKAIWILIEWKNSLQIAF